MACYRPPYWLTLIFIHVLLTSLPFLSAQNDSATLIKFRSSLTNFGALNNWDVKVPPCNTTIWTGQLQYNNLRQENIPVNMLRMDQCVQVTALQNWVLGGTHRQLDTLRSEKFIFSGDIEDDAFKGFSSSMTKVELANNEFTGNIPTSLTQLSTLIDLQLQNNKFDGKIPDFEQTDLKVNFSNNRLDGSIPKGLSNQDPSAFAVLAAIMIVPFVIRSRKNTYKNHPVTKSNRKNTHKPNVNEIQMRKEENYKRTDNGGKLHFVRPDRERFELEDLLRASADVLGSGSFGSSYKAMLVGGPAVVVKRFKEMSNAGKEDFHAHMRLLGGLEHPNLLPLVSFYYKKDEKLLITDFAANGSLASHLHVKRRPDEPGLDWATRLKIIKGVARGLDYLYNELPRLSLPHGHLKSSNVLLDDDFNPLLADYALVPVINKDHAQHLMVAYKSPEFTQHGRTTKKTDVWCLGILILEMLTGKYPANYLEQGKGGKPDLGTWVNSVVREEWTGEVFDKEMKGTKNGEGEMLKLLKIGMCCCEWDIVRRWDIKEAIEKIEGLKEREDEEDYSSYASEGDAYSSRAMDDENFSFSVTIKVPTLNNNWKDKAQWIPNVKYSISRVWKEWNEAGYSVPWYKI
ncbi:pollen receptor-like kinase 4, partial [Tanacetum coccineum]